MRKAPPGAPPVEILKKPPFRPAARLASALFAVADKGPDHAILTAVFVAVLEGGVLRLAELRRIGIAVRAAGLMAVDRERDAALVGGDDLVAAFAAALLDRGGLGRFRRRIVIGVAVG